MGLTRPRFEQLNTIITNFTDPISVLNKGSTQANIDIGFIFNRDGGTSSNVALFWDESANTFVTAFTTNSGISNANISIGDYTNLTVGTLYGNIGGGSVLPNVYITGSLLPAANVTYDLGSPTHKFRSAYFSGNTVYIGGESISVAPDGTWTFTSSGANVNLGAATEFNPPSANISGNVTASYFFGNGSQLSGIITSVVKIISGNSDITTYEGSNIAVSVGGVANTVVFTSSNTFIKGSLLPAANVTYDIGSPTNRFRSAYFSGNSVYIGEEAIHVAPDGTWTFTSDGHNINLGINHDFNPPSANISGNVTARYFIGSGQFLTGLPTAYSNVNVKAYTESMGFQNYGNVNVAAYVTTNGLTNYSNVNVKAYTESMGFQNYGNVNVKAYTESMGFSNYSNVNLTAYLGGAVTVGGSLTVQGNLTVQGTTTTVNSTTLDVSDLNITVAKGAATFAAANGAGLTVDGSQATLLYTSTTDSWNINKAFLSNSYINTTGNISAVSIVATNLTGTLQTASQTNITAVGTLDSLNVSGNVLAANVNATRFIGNGSQLTGINSFSNVFVTGQTPVLADSISDTLTLVGGTGISITTDADNDSVTISAVSTTGPFATDNDFGLTTDAVSTTLDLGDLITTDSATLDLGTLISADGLIYPGQLVLPSYTVSTLPSATIAAQLIYVSNETGGAVLAFSDGTNWRRVTDRAIVS
jgi:hypothetical protein